MGIHPTYIRLRNKLEADKFLSQKIKPGDIGAKLLEIPDSISGQTVKVESVLGTYKRKRYIISYTDPVSGTKNFKTIHPSSVEYSYSYNKEVFSQ